MTLQAELDAFKDAWLDRVGPDVARLVDDDNASLAPLAAKAAKTGDAFPALTLRDQTGAEINLGALYAGQRLVVVFYRGGWCPYCNLELRAYQQRLAEIDALGAQLIAVSPETPDNTLSTAEKNDLAFTVLSDARGQLADALGIRFELSPLIRARYAQLGHDLPVLNADDRWSLPLPATFVVDKGGRIVQAFVDPDYRKRLDPSAVLETLRALSSPSIHA